MESKEDLNAWKLLLDQERTDELLEVFKFLEGKKNE